MKADESQPPIVGRKGCSHIAVATGGRCNGEILACFDGKQVDLTWRLLERRMCIANESAIMRPSELAGTKRQKHKTPLRPSPAGNDDEIRRRRGVPEERDPLTIRRPSRMRFTASIEAEPPAIGAIR